MDDLRWDDLQIFLAAHKAGTFSAAARALRIEQSTVSRRIASLESSLGAALFLRSRQGLVLTEQGERIVPLALDAQDRINELAEVAHGRRVAGTVRVALTESMAVYGLAERLDKLLDAHPDLQIQLVTSTEASDLGRREADVAVRLFQPRAGDLIAKRVTYLDNGLWGHARWQGTPWDALEWVGLESASDVSPGRLWTEAHAPRPPRLVTNGFLSFVDAVRRGIGVGVLPDPIAVGVAELVRIPAPAEPPAATPVYLVAHRASRHVPRVAALWDVLERYLCTLA